MKNLITLPSEQLKLIQCGEKVMLCVPLGEQPPEGYRFYYSINDHTFFRLENPKSEICINHTYPIGTVIGIRETWSRNETTGEFLYKTDYSEKFLVGLKKGRWRSPATMPSKAIIRHVKVIGNMVKRVQDVSNDELCLMGFNVDIPLHIKQQCTYGRKGRLNLFIN
ncbi:hypothetical protein LCGC14_1921230 [marine sediment metagenome]|uniref:Uncharacterized protein n=1 Tax=marine sediment metagenome TaxID=412755 RepID=A0A0F9FRK2_9ZZZZ